MTAFLLLSIIGKALEIRKFMAPNDLPEQSHKEQRVSKRGRRGKGLPVYQALSPSARAPQPRSGRLPEPKAVAHWRLCRPLWLQSCLGAAFSAGEGQGGTVPRAQEHPGFHTDRLSFSGIRGRPGWEDRWAPGALPRPLQPLLVY